MSEYQVAWVHGVLGPIEPRTLPELLPEKAGPDEETQGGIFIGNHLPHAEAALHIAF
jgi:hypothetical protein